MSATLAVLPELLSACQLYTNPNAVAQRLSHGESIEKILGTALELSILHLEDSPFALEREDEVAVLTLVAGVRFRRVLLV